MHIHKSQQRIVLSLFVCVLATLVSLLLSSCGKSSSSSTAASKNPTDGDPNIGVIDNTAGFYVRVNAPENVTYTVHRDVTDKTDFSQECTILPTATGADTDIMCIIEGNELDLAFHGLEYYFNVPAGMCHYVFEKPYYYYGYEPGQGPTSVSVTLDATGAVTASTITPAGYATVDAAGTPICKYDYSRTNGPNCCTGYYTYTKNDNGTVTTVVSPWGGSYGSCGRGPAMTGKLNTVTGLPTGVFYNVAGTGINRAYKIDPQGIVRYADVFVANYFNPLEHVAGGGYPTAFLFNQTPTAPLVAAPPTNPYYTYVCYDEDQEFKARIRVMIRDWNLASEFAKGGSGNPESVAGSDTVGPPDPPGIDDHPDWNALENILGITFPKTVD